MSLEIAPGEVRGLVGESGAGKSMIARAIFGLLPGGARITRGTILFDGRDLVAMPERERRALLGREIALIPQDPMTSLNPVKRVGEQIATVLRLKLGLSTDARRSARAVDLLADVAIREPARVLAAYPHELSGGMRQRILIAIAFACRPRLVVADEPTTALDVTVQRQILRLIHDLQHRDNAAVLFVTHDLGLVAKLCQTRDGAPRRPRGGGGRDARRARRSARTPTPARSSRRRRASTVPPMRFRRCRGNWSSGSRTRRASTTSPIRRTSNDRAAGPPPGLRVSLPDRARKPLFGAAPMIEVVKGIDLDIPRGCALGLVGESGSGKTTIGRALVRLIRPSGGELIYDGVDIAGLGGGARPSAPREDRR